jgi:hypothetical protein
VSKTSDPDLSLFFDILQTLEAINAPYMVIGAFAATVYGITRVTYDIDIVVDLTERHINALCKHYPPPRYYADPEQMRNSIRRGIMFNIIDSSRGEKADLVPLSMASPYRPAFQDRVRHNIETPDGRSFEIWCARVEDVILGKLMAWAEGQGRRHETDIYEMMVSHYLDLFTDITADFDEAYVDVQATRLGEDVSDLWQATKTAAQTEAEQIRKAQ